MTRPSAFDGSVDQQLKGACVSVYTTQAAHNTHCFVKQDAGSMAGSGWAEDCFASSPPALNRAMPAGAHLSTRLQGLCPPLPPHSQSAILPLLPGSLGSTAGRHQHRLWPCLGKPCTCGNYTSHIRQPPAAQAYHKMSNQRSGGVLSTTKHLLLAAVPAATLHYLTAIRPSVWSLTVPNYFEGSLKSSCNQVSTVLTTLCLQRGHKTRTASFPIRLRTSVKSQSHAER